MSILFGFIITLASLLGGFSALGGHIGVIWQPWEFVIIAGMALGIYIVANPWKVVIAAMSAPLSWPWACSSSSTASTRVVGWYMEQR